MFSPITWHHIIFQISSHCITIYHVLSCNIVISLQTSFCFTVIFPKKTTPANPGVETTPKKNTLAAPLALLGKNEESPCLLRYLLPSWTKSPEHKALLADQTWIANDSQSSRNINKNLPKNLAGKMRTEKPLQQVHHWKVFPILSLFTRILLRLLSTHCGKSSPGGQWGHSLGHNFPVFFDEISYL